MVCSWLVCACLLATLAPAHAMARDTLAQRNCPTALMLEGAVTNATLYRQVFEWAHSKDVAEWSYAQAPASAEFVRVFGMSVEEGAALECATVHYATTVRLPDLFAAFMQLWRLSTDVALTVDKEVCRSDHAILERAVVREPVLHEIHMLTRHEAISPWDLRSTSHMNTELPWYAQLIETQIGDELDKSVREKGDAVMHSVCAEPLFSLPATLRLKRPNATLAALVSAAPQRRKFSLRRTAPRFDAQPHFHQS